MTSVMYAVRETHVALTLAADTLEAVDPDGPAVEVLDLSLREGGEMGESHISHQSGRDVDLSYFYENDWEPGGIYVDVPPEHLDAERTWLLIAALLETHQVQRIFIDYELQPLLPGKLSQLGPGLAWGDFDTDGDDDLYVGGAAGQSGELFINDGVAGFRMVEGPWREDAASEDMAALWIDSDSDGDLDAIVGKLGEPNEIWLNVRPPAALPGDANRDGVFDQLDIIQVLQAGKYNTGEPAEWGEGDWNGDSVFDQLDIVEALKSGRYA